MGKDAGTENVTGDTVTMHDFSFVFPFFRLSLNDSITVSAANILLISLQKADFAYRHLTVLSTQTTDYFFINFI